MANKNPPLLQGSSVSQEEQQQVAHAAKTLGLVSMQEARGAVVINPQHSPFGGGSMNSVAVHLNPDVNLVQAFEFFDSFTLILQAVKRDPKPVYDMLDHAKTLTDNQRYHEFIDGPVRNQIFPKGDQGFARQLTIGGRANAMIPVDGEKTGSLEGEIPSYNDAGAQMSAVINGYPFGKWPEQTWLRTNIHPFVQANPVKITKANRHLEYNGKIAAYWFGVTSLHLLPELLKMDCDFAFFIKRLKDSMDVICVARKLGSQKEIADIEGKLSGIGPWERVKGADLMTAYRCYVPGGNPPPMTWKHHKIPNTRLENGTTETQAYLALIAAEVTNTGDLGGTVPCGKREANRTPNFIDISIRGTIAFIGQQQSGKTTLAEFMALCQTPYVVILQQTSVEGESASEWIEQFGGQVKTLNLPDAQNEEQERIEFQKDEADAKAFVARLFNTWRRDGIISGLPILVRPSSQTLRNSRWINEFDKAFRFAWAHWQTHNAKHPEFCVVIVDDVVGIPERKKDAYLGEMVITEGDAIRAAQRTAIDTAAKQYTRRFYTAHDKDEFIEWPLGFYPSLTLEVELSLDHHALAALTDPRSRSKKEQAIARGEAPKKSPATQNPYADTQHVLIRLDNGVTKTLGRRIKDRLHR